MARHPRKLLKLIGIKDMKTLQISASTKKGETQNLRFLVVQEIPYPDISGECGSLKWRNFGGIFSQYGRKAEGIGASYFCHLLADTAPEVIPPDYNRTVFAGYVDYKDQIKINGGTFKLRGKDLGEMSIHFSHNPTWPEIKINGFNAPSKSERESIQELICPALIKFIEQNRASLKAEAVAKIKAQFQDKLKEARETLTELENQAATAIY